MVGAAASMTTRARTRRVLLLRVVVLRGGGLWRWRGRSDRHMRRRTWLVMSLRRPIRSRERGRGRTVHHRRLLCLLLLIMMLPARRRLLQRRGMVIMVEMRRRWLLRMLAPIRSLLLLLLLRLLGLWGVRRRRRFQHLRPVACMLQHLFKDLGRYLVRSPAKCHGRRCCS